MWRQFRTAIIFLVVFTVITGVIYPLIVTGVAQAFFHRQANGSLIVSNGTVSGSSLIGQQFSDPKYFWGRLSATSQSFALDRGRRSAREGDVKPNSCANSYDFAIQ